MPKGRQQKHEEAVARARLLFKDRLRNLELVVTKRWSYLPLLAVYSPEAHFSKQDRPISFIIGYDEITNELARFARYLAQAELCTRWVIQYLDELRKHHPVRPELYKAMSLDRYHVPHADYWSMANPLLPPKEGGNDLTQDG